MSTGSNPKQSQQKLLKSTANKQTIEINDDEPQKNIDDDNNSPLAFVALILITTLFLSAIIFQSNDSDDSNSSLLLKNKNKHNKNQGNWPIVISTWNFVDAVEIAYDTIIKTNDSLESIISGCSYCEYNPWDCGWSVGYGAKPDSAGEVTLDSLIMYGPTHSAGSVGQLRNIKNAIGVANAVMQHTTHTLLVGESATKFAEMMGFKKEDLSSQRSKKIYKMWKNNNKCQPNSYMNLPNVNTSCPPYVYDYKHDYQYNNNNNNYDNIGSYSNHDTIGMIGIDKYGYMTIGASTNGLRYKIHGRVGDSALVGHGGYVKQGVGGAVATGNGDIMMLYAPTRIAVKNMENGHNVQDSCDMALKDITDDYKKFEGALVCMDAKGNYAASKYMNRPFHYVYKDQSLQTAKLLKMN